MDCTDLPQLLDIPSGFMWRMDRLSGHLLWIAVCLLLDFGELYPNIVFFGFSQLGPGSRDQQGLNEC